MYRFPVPVLDPVVLRVSGYCPFQVLFSPVFWCNSFVVVHYRILPLVISILKRLSIKKVVVYFDEYLVHLNHRLVLRKIDVSRIGRSVLDLDVEYDGERIRFGDLINRYNRLIDRFVEEIFGVYNEEGYEICERYGGCREIFGPEFLGYVARVVNRDVDLYPVMRHVFDAFKRVVELLELFYKRYRIALFRRLERYIVNTFNSFYRVEFDGWGYRRVFDPEVDAGGGIASAFGGYVYSFMALLEYIGRKMGKEIYVVSSSVDDSDFSFVGDVSDKLGLRIVSPYSNLRYHRLSIVYSRGVVRYPSYPFAKDSKRVWRYVKSLSRLLELLKHGKRNVAVIVDKESMLRLAKMFEKLSWKVDYSRDDENPEVIDYVVVRRPDNSIILMFHPHGRTAMGVDPSFKDRIESVVVALGLRSYPRSVVPIPRVFRNIVHNGMVVAVDGVPGCYAVVKNNLLYVYDIFSLKYDLHLAVQVIGRFFLSESMRYILLNPRYGIKDIKFFFLISYVDIDRYGLLAGRVYRLRFVSRSGREYSEFELKKEGLRLGDVRVV